MISTPFDSRYVRDEQLLTVGGEVDSVAMVQFDRLLGRLVKDGGGTLDLTGVTFLPSTALSAVVKYQQEASRAGLVMHLAAQDGSIAHSVLKVTGLLGT